MFIRKIIVLLIVAFVMVACSSATPTPEASATPAVIIVTATPLPTLTPTQTFIPTTAPTATSTLRPTAVIPTACTNDLEFVADMSIPDGSVVSAGATITKTWRVRNAGTCTWNSNYTFRQIGGDALTAPTVAAPVAGRGQIIDISVTLTVGTNVAAYDNLERATFQMFNASGVAFGDAPYIEVAIQAASSGCTDAMTITNAPSEIGFLSAGEILPVSWTILNSGTCTWNGYTVERLGSGSPLLGANLPLTLPNIAPGQSHTFTVNATMADGTTGFGIYNMVMVVMNSAGTQAVGSTFMYQAEYDSGSGCFWDSDFVTDVTIPDGTVVNVGESFTKTWRLENSGTCSWDNFRILMIEDEDNAFEFVGVNNYVTLPFVAPGDTVDISVVLRLRNTVSDGETVRARFQIQGVESTFFGTMPYVEVEANR